jgi:hypothetical protein
LNRIRVAGAMHRPRRRRSMPDMIGWSSSTMATARWRVTRGIASDRRGRAPVPRAASRLPPRAARDARPDRIGIFEVRLNGVPQNPTRFLQASG